MGPNTVPCGTPKSIFELHLLHHQCWHIVADDQSMSSDVTKNRSPQFKRNSANMFKRTFMYNIHWQCIEVLLWNEKVLPTEWENSITLGEYRCPSNKPRRKLWLKSSRTDYERPE